MNLFSRRPQTTKAAIVALFAISTFGAIMLSLFAKSVTTAMGADAFQTLYQFIFMVVLGGGIALIYKSIDREHAVLQELRKMHAEILVAYNRAKTVRREFRAMLQTRKSIDEERTVTRDYYVSRMQELNMSQLTYEVYSMRAESELFFSGDKDALAGLMRDSEKYLNGILKEYQDSLVLFEGDPPSRRLKDLPRLCEFIGPHSEDGDFEKKLASTNERLLEALARVMLK